MEDETLHMDEAETRETALRLCESYLENGGYRDIEPLDGGLVAMDGDEVVLVRVMASVDPDSEALPPLELDADDEKAMRHACLAYLADHAYVHDIRHDVISIVIMGRERARLRHLVGAYKLGDVD